MINFLKNLKKEEESDIDALIHILKNKEIHELSEKIYNNLIDESKILDEIHKDKKILLSIAIVYALIKPRLMDPINPFFYYNSSELLNDIIFFIEKYYIFYLNKTFLNKERNLIYKFLLKNIDNLVEKKIIIEKKIRTNNKTIKYWGAEIFFIYDEYYLYLNISYNPYKIIRIKGTTFIIGDNFLKVFIVFKKNIYSNQSIEIKDDSYIKDICERWVYIDNKILNDIIIHIENYEKIKFKDLDKYIIEKNIVYDQNIVDSNMQKKKNEKHFKELSYYKKYFDMRNLQKLNIKKKIYFPFFFDFRGRMYYDSPISVTSSKFLRYIYNYGYYDNTELNNLSSSNEIKKIVYEHTDQINLLRIKYDIKCSMKWSNEVIFWIGISLGKIFINKNNVSTNIKEFLNNAINNPKKKMNLEDSIDFYYYEYVIRSLNDKFLIKRIIIKDATASVFQNLIRLLSPKNNESLVICNMQDSYNWYDTYSFILSKWKSIEEKKISAEYLKYFTRKTVKKSIMTSPYSVTYISSYDYFRNALLKEFSDIDTSFGSEIEKIFKKFYTFIKNDIELSFFLMHKTDVIIEYAIKQVRENKKILIKFSDGESDLIYFKMKSKTWDIRYKDELLNDKRVTKDFLLINIDEVDEYKIRMSIRANIVHLIDAILIREINRNMRFIYLTIHDSFLIDILNISKFIDIANFCNSESIIPNLDLNIKKLKIFSIFIML